MREPEKEIRALSREEFRKLVDVCTDVRLKAFVLLAGTMGLRRGEVLNMRWQDVDFLNDTVHVVNHDGWTTKSKRNRSLPMTPSVRDALLEVDRLYHKGRVDLIFTTRDGRPWI